MSLSSPADTSLPKLGADPFKKKGLKKKGVGAKKAEFVSQVNTGKKVSPGKKALEGIQRRKIERTLEFVPRTKITRSYGKMALEIFNGHKLQSEKYLNVIGKITGSKLVKTTIFNQNYFGNPDFLSLRCLKKRVHYVLDHLIRRKDNFSLFTTIRFYDYGHHTLPIVIEMKDKTLSVYCKRSPKHIIASEAQVC